MYRVVTRGFQYVVVNGLGVTSGRLYRDRVEALLAADGLSRGRGY
jgi:hypothetical protein